MALRRFALATVFFLCAAAVPTAAQGPLQKRVNFTISVPFELSKSDIVLPPGDYVLYQISMNDNQLFALYPDDMTRSPIAMIRTVRINHSTRWPQKTRLLMEINESSPQNYPTLQGWNIPGEDGWELISVVAKRSDAYTSAYNGRSVSRSRRTY